MDATRDQIHLSFSVHVRQKREKKERKGKKKKERKREKEREKERKKERWRAHESTWVEWKECLMLSNVAYKGIIKPEPRIIS